MNVLTGGILTLFIASHGYFPLLPGSYGGILAAALRMKYPTIFHGAIAASAPTPIAFNMMGNGRTTSDFYSVVTDDA